ncbi:unnamed protein product, partial [Polarella glacialis]
PCSSRSLVSARSFSLFSTSRLLLRGLRGRMATGVAGLAGAGAATAAGFGLFGYNRENFLYDAELRFERFSAGREFAIGQQEQFRADIKALTALTAKKNGIYAVVATLDMALCVALYCAGRLGLHGPAPPGWIM